jgi:hypothetical protein
MPRKIRPRKVKKSVKTFGSQPQDGAYHLTLHPALVLPRSVVLKDDYLKVGEEKTEIDDRKVVVHPALLRSMSARVAMGFSGYTPLPSRLHVRLKYVSTDTLTSGVTPGLKVFSANGLYDPDITGTGHQPRGFDQVIALYDHYVVLSSKCKVHFSATTNVCIVGIQLQSSSTAQSDFIDYTEQARCEYSMAPYVATTGGVPEPREHHMDFHAKEFMSIPDPITATKLQGTILANPADQAYYHVFVQHTDGSTSAGTVAVTELIFDAVFFEPVPVASS